MGPLWPPAMPVVSFIPAMLARSPPAGGHKGPIPTPHLSRPYAMMSLPRQFPKYLPLKVMHAAASQARSSMVEVPFTGALGYASAPADCIMSRPPPLGELFYARSVR